MARIETDPNYTTPTFSRATAATDIFKKEDVQNLAAAVSTHDHTSGKGLVLSAAAIPDGAITSAKIADGTIVAGDLANGAVTTPKIADGAVTSVKLAGGVPLVVSNLLTNGGFEIWQRGAGPFGLGAYGPDRWLVDRNGSSTLSVTRAATTDALGGQYMATINYTHAAGGDASLVQTLEDFRNLRGRTVTFCARVDCNGANNVRLAIYNGTTFSFSPFAVAGWQMLAVTATIDAAATLVTVRLIASTFTDVAIRIDNAMLVVGSVPADFVPMHPADDLARCLRYYEAQGGGSNEVLATGQANSTTVAHFPIRFNVRKAVTPTVTVAVSGDSLRATSSTGAAVAGSTQSCSDSTVDGTRLVWTGASASLIAGNATILYSNASNGTVIAEANP
jgi:hypothetical protein